MHNHQTVYYTTHQFTALWMLCLEHFVINCLCLREKYFSNIGLPGGQYTVARSGYDIPITSVMFCGSMTVYTGHSTAVPDTTTGLLWSS